MPLNVNPLPLDVGILSLEVYFPKCCVRQSDLEKFDSVSAGKYVIGLGQEKMAFTAECEDIYSMFLSVTQSLIENTKTDFADIGRLEVGTETIIDKSKSIKSVIMQLFEKSGNYDVEGVDNINACYGLTAALFNTVNWIQSDSWDGRLGLVVGGDIAVYSKGAARPTGGAGAVAILIGPNAPLVLDPIHSTFSKHLYDFYKPQMESEYPLVDGQLSIQCYLQALDYCYENYKKKAYSKNFRTKLSELNTQDLVSLNHFNFICFHSPYSKLVEKSYARLNYLDLYSQFKHLQALGGNIDNSLDSITKHHCQKSPESTYFDKNLEKDMMLISKSSFMKKTLPTLSIAKHIGNMYTPSLYGSLISLLEHLYECGKEFPSMNGQCVNNGFYHVNGDADNGKDGEVGQIKFPLKIGMFSYGSGAIATFFSITIKRMPTFLSNFMKRMDSRVVVEPKVFAELLSQREATHLIAPFAPKIERNLLFPGTFYLVDIDEKYRRTYERMPL